MTVPPISLSELLDREAVSNMAKKRQRQRNRRYAELDRIRGHFDVASEVGWPNLQHYSEDAPDALRQEQNPPNTFN